MGTSLTWHAEVIHHRLTVISSYKSSKYKAESMGILKGIKFAVA